MFGCFFRYACWNENASLEWNKMLENRRIKLIYPQRCCLSLTANSKHSRERAAPVSSTIPRNTRTMVPVPLESSRWALRTLVVRHWEAIMVKPLNDDRETVLHYYLCTRNSIQVIECAGTMLACNERSSLSVALPETKIKYKQSDWILFYYLRVMRWPLWEPSRNPTWCVSVWIGDSCVQQPHSRS